MTLEISTNYDFSIIFNKTVANWEQEKRKSFFTNTSFRGILFSTSVPNILVSGIAAT
jgi:hypothetical protein